ncbi:MULTISPECIES: alkaline phosphatase D family protein [unclassified Janthinobacterium]|uniref:alkaline phosphatase D family protein n=1 Tax=unclassified Janthinobacterium TaxID=2610881 RepID=UPI0003489FA4|nr:MULTISPECIES: alkaline phosphatase D family protein [unclassified Janthinobacterium]MEC5161875.1 alkaline phosphatase D [Janthinobacterium sp. CG_S6]
MTSSISRRRFLSQGGMLAGASALGGALLLPGCGGSGAAPAVLPSEAERPKLPSGIQFGDVTGERAVIWSRSDRNAQMIVEYDTTERFANASRIVGPTASEASDFTTRVDLSGLPAGQTVFVRVRYVDPDNGRIESETVSGQFRTPPAADGKRPLRFHWSGDTAGQGWGINSEFGGVKMYEAMRRRDPDFFIHNGDTIYADGPIQARTPAEDGRIWTSLVTEEVSKVAETLKEYRGRHAYNTLDLNFRKFAAQVPQIWQWDDHEVTNNYSGSKDLSADPRYTEKNVATLAARGRRAFLEYAPMRYYKQAEPQRIYRSLSYGPLLDVFVLDMRSYRGPNSANLQSVDNADSAFLGTAQVDWLIAELAASKATWKVVAADMPIGLQVGDGKDAQGNARWEGSANGDHGAPSGRELEMARLLKGVKAVKNVVWITTDVHYCAAHYYDPAKAQFSDFAPFWEFVAGPMNAGSFGPGKLDKTFGPTEVFARSPVLQNSSPFAGFQFFGEVSIEPQTKAMTVELLDLNGVSQFAQTIPAAGV